MTDTTTDAAQAQDVHNNGADQAQKTSENSNGGLSGLKLAQLKALASQLGISGSSRMRKSDLVDAISAHQRGGAVADRDQKKSDDASGSGPQEKKQSGDSHQETSAQDGSGQSDSAQGHSGKGGQGRGGQKNKQNQGGQQKSGQSQQDSGQSSSNGRSDDQQAESEGKDGQDDQSKGNNRHRRHRDRQRGGDSGHGDRQQQSQQNESGQQNHQKNQDNHQSEKQDRQQDGQQDEGGQRNRGGGQGGGDRHDRNDRRNRRRNRNDRNRRNRDRNRGPEHDDTEVTDEDQLIPIAGILDVLDNYAFVRTSGYLPGQNDVYVSLQQVKKNSLRKGDVVTGYIKAPNENNNNNNQRNNKRQKFAALVKVEKVNGRPVESNTERVDFNKLTPLYPQERLRLESSDPKATGPRVIDLVAPIGKGQRGLIVSPPKAGKTIILQSVANAIKTNNPEVHLMMVLVDERPEEVTDMQRTVDGEVIASTFDRPADDHTTVAELAIERAKRLVELGKDVVILLDSMTRLGRAYNQAAPASGRILSGGVDASALYPPKRFFGAARNIENGGSLTILASALVETGSKMDEVIFEEFKGTGNMELRLSRHLADRRIFPAVDVNASSTRREENLLSSDEVKIMWKLRRVLSGLDQQQGLELLMNKLKDTRSNAEFLMLISKTTLGGNGD